MSKKNETITIRGRVRTTDDGFELAGLTVEGLDENLVPDRRLGTATTDDKGRFALHADKDHFDGRPTAYLQIKNARGDVIHLSAASIAAKAAANRTIDLELGPELERGPIVEIARGVFPDIVALNPNYFGGAPGGSFPVVSEKSQDTSYEELGCIGLSPDDDTLEAVLTIKRSYGYRGGLCKPGSKEYVAFFIDYGDGNGFVPAGAPVSVRVHDLVATGTGPIHYAVRRAFDPLRLHECTKPQVVELRAILSWEQAPTGPNFVPVWGNVEEARIQLRPKRPLVQIFPKSIAGLPKLLTTGGPPTTLTPTLSAGSQVVLEGDLEAIKETVDASLAALDEQARSGKIEMERAEAPKLLAKNPNYFGSLSTSTDPAELLEAMAELPIFGGLVVDEQDLLPVIPQSSTKYEELTCVGLFPEHDLLAATFVIKEPYGYGGGLCTTGSAEYVAFYIDWGDGMGFGHVGTSVVRVHDIPDASKGPLHYATTIRIEDIAERLKACTHENVVKVRAVLSWGYDPTAFGPGGTPGWGNVIERRIQIRPEDGLGARCDLNEVSGVNVAQIAQLGADRGLAYDPHDPSPPLDFNRPFGGIVACHGDVKVGTATHYRFSYSADGGANWDLVRDPRYAYDPFVWTGVGKRAPDANGWHSIAQYQTDRDRSQSTPLVHWRTHGKNGLHRLRLELGKSTSTTPIAPIPGQQAEVDLLLDNSTIPMYRFGDALPSLPMTGIAIKSGAGAPKKCGKFEGNETIRVFGNFRDPYYKNWSVSVIGGNIAGSHAVGSGSFRTAVPGVLDHQGIIGAVDGSAGKELATFELGSVPQHPPMTSSCAYVLRLSVSDRVIVGSLSGYAFTTTVHRREAHVTFNWEP